MRSNSFIYSLTPHLHNLNQSLACDSFPNRYTSLFSLLITVILKFCITFSKKLEFLCFHHPLARETFTFQNVMGKSFIFFFLILSLCRHFNFLSLEPSEFRPKFGLFRHYLYSVYVSGMLGQNLTYMSMRGWSFWLVIPSSR